MITKNSFLKSITWLVFLPSLTWAQVDRVGAARFPDHPRILLLKGEEATIQRTVSADKTWGHLNQAILTECDGMLPLAPLERIKIGRRLLSTCREGLRRIFYMAYAYRMTHQEKYLKRAEQELLAVSAFSDWNPTHFLDVAEMTMAVSIGYDWLYNALSAESRAAIKDAILKKGVEPSLDTKFNSWLTVTNNWNQVCNAGMAYGAMAIYEDQPELAKRIINRSIESIVRPMGDYSPNGAYPEGYSYWGYGTSFNVMFISALDKLFGTDFGLSQKPGFLNSAGYMENMTGPTGDAFNYSDSGLNGELQPAMFWFANKLKDPSLLWEERRYLTNPAETKRQVKDRLLPATLLWSNGISMDAIRAPKSTTWVGSGTTPVALMRTSWSDPAAIFVGFKGGSPGTNHAHMDAGSFVMDADGVRWAMDFGMQSYETLESKGVDLWNKTQHSQRWEVFRYNNYVHNTLTINDSLQRVAGKAEITSASNTPLFMNATTDLTTVYKGSVAQAKRGIAIMNKDYVVVRDELETLPTATTVRWTMLTSATVTVTGNKAELTKDGKKLTLLVQEPATIELKTWPTDPPHDYDAPNPGTTRVGFEVTVPTKAKTALTVLLIPEKAATKIATNVQPLDQWPH
ncbi:heparinase II/III domain-containing protein [Spirosoma jeollabukense]